MTPVHRAMPTAAGRSVPQVKICGLTRAGEAAACAAMGADAVGLVFHPQSPRYVSSASAGTIVRALPKHVSTVGVFVDEPFEIIMRAVETIPLKAVQLHGIESPGLVEKLRREAVVVIKTLFTARPPFLEAAGQYSDCAFLVECGRGKLPGGNAQGWDYRSVRTFGEHHPLILAGGLRAANIRQAVASSLPDAVDLSSGLERRPGRKDLEKVKHFFDTMTHLSFNKPFRRIF